MSVPRLERSDIEEALRALYAEKRRHHLFAFFGTGDSQEIEIRDTRIRVVPVESELDLRMKLPGWDEPEPAMAFLVPWDHDMPFDLRGRFVLEGRVRRIGREARLKRIFGVTEIDSAVLRSAVVDVLLTKGPQKSSGGGRLTLGRAWTSFLESELGVPIEEDRVLGGAFLAWAATQAESRKLGALSTHDLLRTELHDWLASTLGPHAPWVWKAWEAGRGRKVLELAILAEAIGESPTPAVSMWLRMTSRDVFPGISDDAIRGVTRALASAADDALRSLERQAGGAEVRGVLQTADLLADEPEIRAAAERSRRLPSGFRARQTAFGSALERAAAQPSYETVSGVKEALRTLENHDIAKQQESQNLLERATMAARLAAWLAARTDRRIEHGASSYAAVEGLGRWYAAEGGFVDWARRWARGQEGDSFGRGVATLIGAVDAVRVELDRRFARGLSQWVQAGRPNDGVLPLDRVIERLVCPFLDERDDRRVLILLLDGMAWAQAVEILADLGERGLPWGPLKWHQTVKGQVGKGPVPVMLANLPSVTDVSRAGFFGGKLVASGKTHDTQKDPERFRDNRHLAKYFASGRVPRLLLRAEGHTRGGAASEEALRLVDDQDARVVAIVINAIDDSLKANPGVHHKWSAQTIQSLYDLLDRARDARRSVLLASDHGHVPADRMRFRTAAISGGARWRAWGGPDEALAEDEVLFQSERENVWQPRGAAGVVLLADDGAKYAGASHAGEHGGASLAEVVTPCLFIGWDDGVRSQDDGALAIKPFPIPPWWFLEEPAPPVLVVEPPRKAKTERPKPATQQVDLFPPSVLPQPTPPPSPVSSVPHVPSALARALGACELFVGLAKSEQRKQALQAVEYLESCGSVASAQAFAAHMNVGAWRVGGLVATLQELLNLDGYDVLRFDAKAKQVYLSIEVLKQVFEIAP